MQWRKHPTERQWKPLLPIRKYPNIMVRTSSTGRQCKSISPRKPTKPWPMPSTTEPLSTEKLPIMWLPVCACGHWKKESHTTRTGSSLWPTGPLKSTTHSSNMTETEAWSKNSAASCSPSRNRTLPAFLTVDCATHSKPAATQPGTLPHLRLS